MQTAVPSPVQQYHYLLPSFPFPLLQRISPNPLVQALLSQSLSPLRLRGATIHGQIQFHPALQTFLLHALLVAPVLLSQEICLLRI